MDLIVLDILNIVVSDRRKYSYIYIRSCILYKKVE